MVVQKERSESREFRQVRLHLEDVQVIEQTLHEIGPDAYKIEFSNGYWEAESIAELATKGTGPFRAFEMKRSDPGLLSFEIRGITTRLYVSNVDDLRLRGAYEKITSILQAAQRPLLIRWYFSMGMFAVFAAVGLVALCAALVNGIRAMNDTDTVPGRVSALCIAFSTISLLGTLHVARVVDRNGVVYLVPRADRPNFFARKKDDLMMLAVGTVVGVLVTLALSALTGG